MLQTQREMKFIISTSQLLNHLQVIGGVISSNNVLPILEDFLFNIEDGRLSISASDLENSMSTVTDVESKDNGKVAIPAKILLETLKTLADQPLIFNVDDNTHAITINTDNGTFKLSGENPDDFPKIPIPEDYESLHVPAHILSFGINKTLFAVSNDELRPAMTGVYVQMGSEGLSFVSTDAHKLVRYTRKDLTNAKEANFILPKKALNLLKNTLPGDDSIVNILHNSSNAFFEFGDIKLICRLIDAKYPDYNAVIPRENNNELHIGRMELQNTLKRISIFSNKTTHQVVLGIKSNQLKVSAQDIDFSNEAHETLACSYTGEDMDIGFNAKFMTEMLSTLPGDEVVLKLSTPSRAGIILPELPDANDDLLMLVMPVMIN